MNRPGIWIAAFALLFISPQLAGAEEGSLSLKSVYSGDFVGNLAGGLHRKASYIGRLYLSGVWDLGRSGLIRGGKIFVSAIETHGGENPSARRVGDLQGVDNIEASDAVGLYEHGYEQSLFDEKLSILAGVYGLDSDFAVTNYGALFLNGSFGTPPEITANTGVSAFPTIGPAVRLKIKPADSLEFLAGIFDGDSTDGKKNRHGVRHRISGHQGVMTIFEAACHPNFIRWEKNRAPLPGTIKFGSWIHTQDVDDVLVVRENGKPHRHQRNYGFYGILDQRVLPEKEGEDQGLGIFFQFGGTPENRNKVDYYLGAGLNYTGLIPRRDQDILGVAVANAFMSGNFREARDLEIVRSSNPPGRIQANESALEFTYRIKFHDHLALQPDYQIVFNPSGEENVKTAHVLILRFEASF